MAMARKKRPLHDEPNQNPWESPWDEQVDWLRKWIPSTLESLYGEGSYFRKAGGIEFTHYTLTPRTAFKETRLRGQITNAGYGTRSFDPKVDSWQDMVVDGHVAYGYVVIQYKGHNVAILIDPETSMLDEVTGGGYFTISNIDSDNWNVI
jgi:hypothetical protein